MNVETTLQQPAAPSPTAPWGIRDIVFAILLAAAGIIALNLLALGASRALNIRIRQNADLLLFFVVLQDLIVVSAAWLFGIVRHSAQPEQIGLRPYSVTLGCTLAATMLFLSFVVRIIYAFVIRLLGIEISPQQVLMQLDVRGSGFILAFVVVAIVAPIAEELVFRGFLYGGLRKRAGIIGAMLISSVFFTALHLSLGLFIPIFVLGLFLAWLYEYTGSLYPGIMLHAANNAIALIALYTFQASGLLQQSGGLLTF